MKNLILLSLFILGLNNLASAQMVLNFTGTALSATCPPLMPTLTSTSQNAASIRWEIWPQKTNGSIQYVNPATGVSAEVANGTTTPFNFTITEPGCYTVKLFGVSATGVQDSLIRSNYICIVGPSATLSVSPTSGCAPLTVTYNITNAIGQTSIAYQTGDGMIYIHNTNAASDSQTHTYTQAGTYYANIQLDNGVGCELNITWPQITVDSVSGFINISNNNICIGSDVKLSAVDAPSGSTYQWQPDISFNANAVNNQEITVQPIVSTVYTVTITSPDGCTKVAAATLTVRPFNAPVVSISPNNTVMACGSNISLFASATQDGSSINSSSAYNWDSSASGLSGYSGIINPIAQPTLQNTTYIVTVTGTNFCTASASVTITLTDGCVFPGDANYNGIANNVDVLSVGLTYNRTGAVRGNQTSWQATPVSDWATTIPNTTINAKHADCDGDGTINANDLAPIYQNYNRTHNNFVPTNRSVFSTNGVPISLRFVQDTFNITPQNDTIIADIFVGNNTTPANNFYGFAASIAYDTAVFRPVSITYDAASFLGATNEVLVFGINDAVASTYDIAITRRTQTAVSGNGRVARIKGVITENIAGKDVFRLATPVVLGINNITAINAQNVIQQAAGIGDTCQASIITNTQNTTDLRQHIRIFPNPTPQNSVLNIVSDGLRLENLQISNMVGQIVVENRVFSEKMQISTQNLRPGIYFIQIKTEKGVFVQKIVVQ